MVSLPGYQTNTTTSFYSESIISVNCTSDIYIEDPKT